MKAANWSSVSNGDFRLSSHARIEGSSSAIILTFVGAAVGKVNS
jgi:hypothetical protein